MAGWKNAAESESQSTLKHESPTKSIQGIHGEYRRARLRALAQRVEVADREVRIMGSKERFTQNARHHFRRKMGYRRRSQFCSGLGHNNSESPK
jgi:hypothetical protein